MNKIITTLAVLAIAGTWATLSHAGDSTTDALKTIVVENAGTLSKLIPDAEKLQIKRLKLSGTLNGDDVKLLREMAGKDGEDNASGGQLIELDLTDIQLTDGGAAYYSTSWSNYYTATSYDVDENEENYYCTDLSYAFCETNLEKVSWPSTMWEVGECAFNRCSTLKSFVLGSETNEIKPNAFEYCTALSHLELTEKILYIDNHAFAGSGLLEITIPNAVEMIDKAAFLKCESLEKVDLGNSVSEIKEEAFSYCTALKSITLPATLKTIGKEAFYGCSALTGVVLPKKLSALGAGAFGACHALKSIAVESGNTKFSSIDGVLFNKEGTTLLTYPNAKTASYQVPEGTILIDNSAFSECDSLHSIALPTSLQEIADEAFYKCTALEAISIPGNVTTIGASAFYGCSALETAQLGQGITTVAESLFGKCTGLKSIDIPAQVKTISYQAFNGCTALTKVNIPAGVETIEDAAFKKCAALNEVYCNIATPLAISDNVFDGVETSKCNLLVPQASVSLYQAANVWKTFIIKEMQEPSGVENTRHEQVRIWGQDNTINIECNDMVFIQVFDTQGRQLYQGYDHHIHMGNHGVCIVKAGTQTVKVAL